MNNAKFRYYVEGECEESFINSIKKDYLHSGKVEVLNPIQDKITPLRLRTLKYPTIAILVYDTDKEKVDILKANIGALEKSKNVKSVICIPQCKNFEDELLVCTSIKKVGDFTGSKTNSEFKKDFVRLSEENLLRKLKMFNFDIDSLWSGTPNNIFEQFENGSCKIKKVK